MKVKVLRGGCHRCETLLENVKKTIEKAGWDHDHAGAICTGKKS